MIFKSLNNVRPRIKVEAKVYRACPACGHSGIINNVYHEDFCPSCGEKRPPVEDRGLIYDNNPLWQLRERIKRKIRSYYKWN